MPRIIYLVQESDDSQWDDEHRVTHAFTTREAAQAVCDRAQAADTTHHMSWSVVAVELYGEIAP